MKKFQNIKKMMEYNTKQLNTRLRWGGWGGGGGGGGGGGVPFQFSEGNDGVLHCPRLRDSYSQSQYILGFSIHMFI